MPWPLRRRCSALIEAPDDPIGLQFIPDPAELVDRAA